MASIATAWVDIVPRITSLDATLREAFKGVEQTSKETGTKSGAALADGLSSSLSKVGGVFAAIGKAALAGAGVAAGAVGAIGKQAFSAYADWEQAVGGVDTLFKDASATVQRYAQEAYRTAGTSANAYMNNVTSFAASLISSMGGNTAAAADMANTAMQDMADNANKMGTSLGSIQETYQSLARGNFEMLDNLKLGFGGTKTEMQRLIDTANEWRVANGEAGDLTIDKFSDVVQAIHIVQGELGITGTTAKEAATTIQGSWGMLQAAWQNWVEELGKDNADLKTRTAEVFTSAEAVASNAFPRIQQIAEGALQGIGQAGQQFLQNLTFGQLDQLGAAVPYIQQLADALASGSISLEDIAKSATLAVSVFGGLAVIGPNLGGIFDAFGKAGSAIETVGGKVSSLKGAFDGIRGVFEKNATLFEGFGIAFSSAFEKPLAAAQGLGGKIAAPFQALAGKVGGFISPVTSAIGSAFGGIGDKIGGPLQAGLGKVGGVVSAFFAPTNFLRFFGIGAIAGAIILALGALNESLGGQLGTMFTNFVTTVLPGLLAQVSAWVTTQMPAMMAQGVYLLTTFLNGITTALPQILLVAAQILTTLVNGIATALPTLVPAAMQMIIALVNGLLAQLPSIIQAGLNLLSGLVQGILNAIPILIAALPNIINSYVNGILGMLPQIMTTGVDLLLKFVDGIVNAIPQLVAALPAIITNFVNGIGAHLPQIIETGITLLGKLVAGLISAIPQLVGAIPQIVSALWNGLTSQNWGEIGLNIIRGIANGIANAAGELWNAAKNAASQALEGAKNFLHINSPSRVFRDQVGVMIGLGLAEGINESSATVSKTASELASATVDPFTGLRAEPIQPAFEKPTQPWAGSSRTAIPSNAATAQTLSREDVASAVIQALRNAPDMNLRLNGAVAAAQLAPALETEFADRAYRGL